MGTIFHHKDVLVGGTICHHKEGLGGTLSHHKEGHGGGTMSSHMEGLGREQYPITRRDLGVLCPITKRDMEGAQYLVTWRDLEGNNIPSQGGTWGYYVPSQGWPSCCNH